MQCQLLIIHNKKANNKSLLMTILAANIDQNPASVTNLETLLNDHITTVTIHHKPATYQPQTFANIDHWIQEADIDHKLYTFQPLLDCEPLSKIFTTNLYIYIADFIFHLVL